MLWGVFQPPTPPQLLFPPSWRRSKTEKLPKRKNCRILSLSVPVLRTPLEAWLRPRPCPRGFSLTPLQAQPRTLLN